MNIECNRLQSIKHPITGVFFRKFASYLQACTHVVGSRASETLRDVSVRPDASFNGTLWQLVIAHLMCKWKK